MRLRAMGYETWILSGDEQQRTQVLGQELGLSESHILAQRLPEEKASWLEQGIGRHALMMGDGVNDSLAVEHALCSGTPAFDRPFMPAKTDFYLVTPGLAPLRIALVAAKRLAKVLLFNLSFAVLYNVGAVAVAAAGLMTPWLAAILMPTSSLLLIVATTAALSQRSALWKF
ncbi:MAG: HAD family hydrolase [Myxococcales bacterium]|nr:MAG: HAD family hydrolase [Myxococcales bacterium]